MTMLRSFLTAMLIAVAGSASALAHFPWIVLTPSEHPTQALIYFGESAAPDDPDLLDKIAHSEVHLLTGFRSEPRKLELTKSEDALVASLGDGVNGGTAVLNLEYGVLTRGDASFLLKYYGKSYASALPGTWRAVNKSELLPLEITPRLDGAQLVLSANWQGQPAAGAEMNVGGPGLDDNLTGTTDAQGEFRCELPESGLFSLRARMVEKAGGERDGQKFDETRHYSTLSLSYLKPAITTAEHSWPALPRGITSFGAAVAGDWLYVYGGHFGAAHSYATEAQSNEFLRLNLAQPTGWEQLPGGPKLTGLAMVAHNGKLYRIGGFTVLNKEGEDERLVSQDSVARFDPETQRWEDLPALPAGRSSLDAAVIGDTIYVVGGWNLQGDVGEEWHDTALKLDLSASQLQWEPIANPGFQRRALSVAAWDGKLYVIGGMQPSDGTTTRTAIYAPATDSWAEGPQILGGGMDGFGTSSFASTDRLTVTTMSGAIQQLEDDGQWEFVGQLEEPRFFHRLLPWRNDLLVVGGADMSEGKRLGLERIPPR